MKARKSFHNTFHLGVVEFFWGIGMNFVSMSAILPVMLKNLNATHFEIGLIPALGSAGYGFPQILSPKLFGGKKKLRSTVLFLHLLTALPLLLTSISLFLEIKKPILAILVGWSFYCFLVGVTFPLWMNYIAKVTDPEKRGNSFGVIFFCQTLAGAAGVFVAGRIYGDDFDYKKSALIFFIAFLSMFIGSFFFLKTKEEGFEEGKISSFVSFFKLAKEYKWLVSLITARVLARGAYLVISSFYIVDIIEKKLKTSQSAVAVGAIALISQAVFSLILGKFGDYTNHKNASLIAVVIFFFVTVVFSGSGGNYYIHIAVAVALGLYISSEFTSFNNLMFSLSDVSHRHSIIAWNGFLNTIPQLFIPVLGGAIIDKYGIPYASYFSAVLLLASASLIYFFVPREKVK
ncbi:MAG: MFS transporter [Acidobacteria bacterium]|nr:MFS transporter [Acidobacteriota bacterium]